MVWMEWEVVRVSVEQRPGTWFASLEDNSITARSDPRVPLDLGGASAGGIRHTGSNSGEVGKGASTMPAATFTTHPAEEQRKSPTQRKSKAQSDERPFLRKAQRYAIRP